MVKICWNEDTWAVDHEDDLDAVAWMRSIRTTALLQHLLSAPGSLSRDRVMLIIIIRLHYMQQQQQHRQMFRRSTFIFLHRTFLDMETQLRSRKGRGLGWIVLVKLAASQNMCLQVTVNQSCRLSPALIKVFLLLKPNHILGTWGLWCQCAGSPLRPPATPTTAHFRLNASLSTNTCSTTSLGRKISRVLMWRWGGTGGGQEEYSSWF